MNEFNIVDRRVAFDNKQIFDPVMWTIHMTLGHDKQLSDRVMEARKNDTSGIVKITFEVDGVPLDFKKVVTDAYNRFYAEAGSRAEELFQEMLDEKINTKVGQVTDELDRMHEEVRAMRLEYFPKSDE